MTNINAAAAQARENARNSDGTFGTQHHGAPGQALSKEGLPLPELLERTVEVYRYGLPSARHRIERYYTSEEPFTVWVPHAVRPERPAARITPDPSGDTERRVPSEVYSIDGRWMIPTGCGLDEYADCRLGSVRLFEEQLDDLKAQFGELAIVDGEVFRPLDGEPGYEVATFGLGGNHGGSTGVFQCVIRDGDISPNGGPSSRYVFAAGERDEAIAFAKRVAVERGDTDSIDRLERVGVWEVADDAPVSRIRRPVEFPKIALRTAPDVDSPLEGQTDEARAELDAVHRVLEAAGVRGVDGRIDWSRVDPTDRDRYRGLLIAALG